MNRENELYIEFPYASWNDLKSLDMNQRSNILHATASLVGWCDMPALSEKEREAFEPIRKCNEPNHKKYLQLMERGC